MREREGGKAADPEALVLPCQGVISQVDLLMHHGELQLRVLLRYNLTGE